MQGILITADALRADHLGQYGYHRNTMSSLDRLADSGKLYEKAIANGAHTELSIPSFLTSSLNGLEYAKTGPTVASVLSNTGIRTAGFHSNAVTSHDYSSVAGFDDWYDFTDVGDWDENQSLDSIYGKASVSVSSAVSDFLEKLRPYLENYELAVKTRQLLVPDTVVHEETPYADAEYITDQLLNWVKNHADEDFFIWAHYMDPHRPYGYSISDPRYAKEMPESSELDRLMAKAGVSPESVTAEEQEVIVNLYDSDLQYLSEQLDRLFDGLQNIDIWNEIDVIFTSDHGEEFAEHGLYYHRNKPYEELIHVPLIHKPSGGHPGERVSDQRELLDVAPTILESYSASTPETFEGQPLDSSENRTIVSVGFRDDQLMVGVREDSLKYITSDSGEELYDLDTDPNEVENLVENRPDEARRLRNQIPTTVFEIPEDLQGLEELSATSGGTKQQLKDLGYLE